MPNITVRDIPEVMYNDLKLFAQKERRSLNSQIVQGLSEYINNKKSSSQRLSEIRKLRDMINVKGFNPTQEELKSAIEEGRE